MHWPDPYSLTLFVVVVICTALAMVAGITWGTGPRHRVRTAIAAAAAMILWMAASAVYASSGITELEPRFLAFAPLLVCNLVLAITVGLSPWGARLARLPVAALVAFHAFRLPLELVLHLWADQGTVPLAMSWGGQNFDVVTAILAILVAPVAVRVPWLVLGFELVGVGMLLNIFRIVAQNTPGSPLWQASDQPALLLAAEVPMVWIVTVCVFGAIVGHVVLARRLWWELAPRARSTSPQSA